MEQRKKLYNNNISWFRGWFIFFSPLLYFSYYFSFTAIYNVMKNSNKYKTAICYADTSIQSSEATTGVRYSFYSITLNNGKLTALRFPIQKDRLNEMEDEYLTEKWAYAHPKESNAGIGETPEEIAEKAKIKVWYQPKSSIAYVISEPKYENEFPADEIIWRNLKWFIGFTILPFYFFCRWMIEWIRVLLVKRKLKIQDEKIL